MEKKRVKLHLMGVEHWMRAKDTSSLNSTQRKNRTAVLRILHDYWKSELFPVNTTHRKKIPQIRDQRGTMCAVAHILYSRGQQTCVNNLAESSNHVLIDDVPDSHELGVLLAQKRRIKKKKASRIQPSYSCQAIVGHTYAVDPIADLFAAIFSIVGPATAASFYWGLNRIPHNFGKNTIRAVIAFGIVMALGGFGMLHQNSMAAPTGIMDFPGTYGNYEPIPGVLVHYWVEGGNVEIPYWNSVMVEPEGDGQITVVYPHILTVGYGDDYDEDYYYERVMAVIGGEETIPDKYKSGGHTVLRVPFVESDSLVEIFNTGLCDKFLFSDKITP